MTRERAAWDVLVVGAGPAGLSTALVLARHGVRVLVAERHAGTSIFPRATGISTRTMELFRAWGIEDQVRAATAGTRMRFRMGVGHTLARPMYTDAPIGFPDPQEARAVSPVAPCFCPQDELEPVLLGAVRAAGGHVRFRTELTGLAMDDTGVSAELRDRDTGASEQVRARFVVGADGPDSTVRSRLAAALGRPRMEGELAALVG